ncbi:retron system putative HNH endonuclease [Methylomagnum ishizawai]|uniref:retron system putative HNH endonuclease n=1 Tax=Methylomagnum ishizawai TaxID=1760988 RepID=UPI001C7EDA25|nr:retron system putative HNH endonuclease [Methylomagnum ishizawai]
MKSPEPKELTEYRCQPDAVYDGPLFTPVKQAIRAQLLREQGYLCAYCMKRIGVWEMKVEHWHCQDHYPHEQLDYQNLLGACQGHEGEPYSQQTCDTRKGNRDLKYHPAHPGHRIESQISFLGNGKVGSADTDFDGQLNGVLNLNLPRLLGNRLAVWNAVHDRLSRKAGSRTPAEIQKLIDDWSVSDQGGQLREYCAVAVYYLRKRLRAMRA